jgi:hypothetical protein
MKSRSPDPRKPIHSYFNIHNRLLFNRTLERGQVRMFSARRGRRALGEFLTSLLPGSGGQGVGVIAETRRSCCTARGGICRV